MEGKKKIQINTTEETISEIKLKPYYDSSWTVESKTNHTKNDIFGNPIQNPDGFPIS